MYEKIIESYVTKLNLNDIYSFSKKENFNILEEDAKTILFYIKKYWYIILKKDPEDIFLKLKEEVNINTYNKVIELYKKYKTKIDLM